MKLALTALLTLTATGLAAPLASAQQIDYVQRPDRADGLYPRVLRGGEQASDLLGSADDAATPNRYGYGKMVHVQPRSGDQAGIRVFKAGKATTVARNRGRRLIKPIVRPRSGNAAIIPVKQRKHRKGTVIIYKPGAFRAVPDQPKSD